jgi:hypothetical protein
MNWTTPPLEQKADMAITGGSRVARKVFPLHKKTESKARRWVRDYTRIYVHDCGRLGKQQGQAWAYLHMSTRISSQGWRNKAPMYELYWINPVQLSNDLSLI